MEQQYNNKPNEFLWALLANPGDNVEQYAPNIQQLVNDYPQSGILQAFLALSAGDKNYKLAPVYFNPKSFYKLVNNPSGFENVPQGKIILSPDLISERVAVAPSIQNRTGLTQATPKTVNPLIESRQSLPRPEVVPGYNPVKEEQPVIKDYFTAEAAVWRVPVLNKISPGMEENGKIPATGPSENNEKDEVFTEESGDNGLITFGGISEHLKDENENSKVAQIALSINKETNGEKNNNRRKNVTKYHDETLPYTFLWWLNKTRIEHAGTYQPYAKPQTPFNYNFNKAKINIDELQHQYIENIFNITSVAELDKSTANKPAVYDTTRKEHQIIERFIKEEPQIKPQQSDKLDNENKARKSSEDRDELVTETLAAIYTEQMLYHKAIASYKKLILKFPEKSSYFAEKIEQLEKKTNL